MPEAAPQSVSAAELLTNPTGGTIVAMVAEYAKVSVTLPAGLLERIRGRVGARGLSSYVAEALEDEERRSALRAWLAEQEDEYGAIPASLLEEVRNEWLGAGG
jgi:post-segregation antitoxin (ccd killing protein)